AGNLQALYQYCMRRLTDAHAGNDVAALDEVVQLMREVQEGWEAMMSSNTEVNSVGSVSVADG
ncbi:MAG: flagellar export chaperone FliS, partial [Endozoicomonas sp.]